MAPSLGNADLVHFLASHLVGALFCRGLQAKPLLLHGWLSGVFPSRKRNLWHIFLRDWQSLILESEQVLFVTLLRADAPPWSCFQVMRKQVGRFY